MCGIVAFFAKTPAFEAKLEAAGAAWTPGRKLPE